LRRTLTELSNKKHKNPYDENLRQEYHKARKNLKKLNKFKKTKLLNSDIDNLVKHKRNKKFWSYLKSINGDGQSYNFNELEEPIDKLYDHFKNLHWKPKPSSLSSFHISAIKNKLALDQQKDTYNFLDKPFSLHEIETTLKLLKSEKALGPDRIGNEKLETGQSPHLKTAICKLFKSPCP